MKYKTFSIRIPEPTADALEAEALQEFRTRNQLINKILTERYHAPPIVPTQTRSAQAKANTARARRNTDVN